MLPDDVIDFYLTHSPYAHSDKPVSAQSLDLSTFGWSGTNLDRLMKWISIHHLDDDKQGTLNFTISSDTGKETSIPFWDDRQICWLTHNGGVFCIKCKISSDVNNSIHCKLAETYATCFFRHLRNAIAHGNYQIENEQVLFKDQSAAIGSKSANLTAYFQTTITFLRELAATVENGPSRVDGDSIANCPPYRITHKVEADVEDRA